MASSLTFSTVLGGNTVTETISSPDDEGVQATVMAAARGLGADLSGKTPKQIMNMWMMWAWNKTESIARAQLEMERLEAARAEIDEEMGRLT
jgi:hypothetical protein